VNHPARLGKYEITEVLGEGAMGVVYKAFDPDIRRRVAVKTIRRQLTDGSDFAANIAARFRNEAQAAGRLTHPGIVAVYEYGEDNQVAYIAMEFVEGRSIASYLASSTHFSDNDIPGIMCQMLDALEHAHSQGVWHRDIKPANVILSRGGTVKIADFGIARVDNGGLTLADAVVGTPAYMAPEQFLGGAIDARVDVYGAGVVLYVLLTGRPPFAGGADELMYKVVHEKPVLPSQVEGVQRPAFYDDIIAAALAKRPVDRYASAAAFKNALVRGVGRPIDVSTLEQTIVRVAPRPASTPEGRPLGEGSIGSSGAGNSSGALGATASRQWDRAVLAEAEQTLAHYLGPLASVLVRRVARDCDSVPALYAKLAEQVTDPAARQVLLGRAMPGASTGSGGSAPGTSPRSAGFDDALLDRVQRRLAKEVGPMAKVIVKQAAASTRDRAAFLARIAESVPEPEARARLLAELERLP
jgi:serine/threonine-protein kinase